MTYADFLARLALEYPKTAKAFDIPSLVIPTLIAPKPFAAPRVWMNEAERLVFLFHNRLRDGEGSSNLAQERFKALSAAAPALSKPSYASVLMSYDFHVDFSEDPVGRLKLIEINTNASMSLMGALMLDRSTAVETTGISPSRAMADQFAADFTSDLKSGLGRNLTGARIAIIDDEPSKQKMYIEFLLYKELLERHGASAAICDRRALEMRDGKLWAADFGPIDLVYNRSTDFYFEEPESQTLREALAANAAVITPNPYDYRLLADKNRLVEWSQDTALESHYGLPKKEADEIRLALLRTREVTLENAEQLWKERKKLMFKPKTAYGGKGVYRGSSVSRGAFDGVVKSGALAQDFVPAPTTTMNGVEFKYDLRFFAYRDQIRLACARLYQGQTTNATTPGGGLVPVSFN